MSYGMYGDSKKAWDEYIAQPVPHRHSRSAEDIKKQIEEEVYMAFHRGFCAGQDDIIKRAEAIKQVTTETKEPYKGLL